MPKSDRQNVVPPKQNKAYVLKKPKEAKLEDRPMPDSASLAADECIVAPRMTGICGSDIHYLQEGRIGDFVVKKPMILGHESSAVVVHVGSKVKHLQPGDRVALEPGQSCRVCEACKRGQYELCPDMVFAATPPYDGTLAGYYTLAADLCYKLPDHLDLEDGAMMEPLAVAVAAVAKAADFHANQAIAVFGAGPVGLLCMAVAKALGARRIVAIDQQPARLEFAQSYVGAEAFTPPSKNDGEDAMTYARRCAQTLAPVRGPDSVDVVVDATGAAPCIQMGLFLAKEGGTYVQVGMGREFVEIPITAILTKKVHFTGSFRYGPGVYDLAIGLVAQGRIDLKPLVSHRYDFAQVDQAFKTMTDGKGEDGKPPIKVLIRGPE